jgi:hypothetical protein
MVRVTFRSDPDGAIVRSDTRVLGRTPFALSFARGHRYKLFFEKPGFAPVSRTFLAADAPAQTVSVRLSPAP